MFFVEIRVIVKPAPPNANIVGRRLSLAFSGSASPRDLPFSSLSVPASVAATPSFAVSTMAGFNLPATTADVSTYRRVSTEFFILL